jgi:hypothetical protein
VRDLRPPRCGVVSQRSAGWSCEHATITVTTTWPPPASVRMAWCGCEMEPVYADDTSAWQGVTITKGRAA